MPLSRRPGGQNRNAEFFRFLLSTTWTNGKRTVPPLAGGPQGGHVSALEAEIDERVCALFGLTAEERRLVEGG